MDPVEGSTQNQSVLVGTMISHHLAKAIRSYQRTSMCDHHTPPFLYAKHPVMSPAKHARPDQIQAPNSPFSRSP